MGSLAAASEPSIPTSHQSLVDAYFPAARQVPAGNLVPNCQNHVITSLMLHKALTQGPCPLQVPTAQPTTQGMRCTYVQTCLHHQSTRLTDVSLKPATHTLSHLTNMHLLWPPGPAPAPTTTTINDTTSAFCCRLAEGADAYTISERLHEKLSNGLRLTPGQVEYVVLRFAKSMLQVCCCVHTSQTLAVC